MKEKNAKTLSLGKDNTLFLFKKKGFKKTNSEKRAMRYFLLLNLLMHTISK